MSHTCYLILVSHHLPPENKALLSIMTSTTITLLFYSVGYLQLLCFSPLGQGSNLYTFLVSVLLHSCFFIKTN